MNDARRKEIAKARQLICDAAEILQAVLEEEQEAFDNMPEGFQNGERGEKMQENISTLETMLIRLTPTPASASVAGVGGTSAA